LDWPQKDAKDAKLGTEIMNEIMDLRASRIEHGLLINFGAPKFQIKKYALTKRAEPGGFGGVLGFVLSLFAFLAHFRG